KAAEPDQLDKMRRARLRLGGAAVFRRAERKRDIPGDGAPGEELVELLEHHDPVEPRSAHRRAVDPDGPLRWRQETADYLEKARLSASGGPQQNRPPARLDAEAQPVDGGDDPIRGPVFEGDGVELQHRPHDLRNSPLAPVYLPNRPERDTCASLPRGAYPRMTDQAPPPAPGRGRRGGGPDPIDIHVGSRIRLRRKMLGFSQERLGAALGLTFQQVQKYERGTNRAGASRLYELSKILDVPISFFFDDQDPVRAPAMAAGFAEEEASAYRPDPLKQRETI